MSVEEGVERRRRLFTVDDYYGMARAGMPELWIVDLEYERLKVYREPAEGRYGAVERLERREVAAPAGLPGVEVAVGEVLG